MLDYRSLLSMGRPLKIVSINFPFKHTGIEQVDSFNTEHALFDFDVVVVRPYSFPRLTGQHEDWEHYNSAEHEIKGKIGDLKRLLLNGGLLVIILDAKDIVHYDSGQYSYTGGTTYTVTNYDFLDRDFHRVVTNGKGTRLTLTPSGSPFTEVLKKSSVEWTAYLTNDYPPGIGRLEVFAANGRDSFVGAAGQNIIFLPNLRQLDEEAFFEACRALRTGHEGALAPDWLQSVQLPGEAEQQKELASISKAISDLQRAQETTARQLLDLQEMKRLLYEKGKYRLEPVVRSALNVLGFSVTEGGDIPGTNYEIDGRIASGAKPGILEIKGSKNQIAFSEFSPLPIKVLKDAEISGSSSKGILIGNGRCEQPPWDRTGEDVFSPHVLQAAKDNSIALVNSVELYAVVCGVMAGSIGDSVPIREKILAGSGHVDLLPFCKTLPFATAVAREEKSVTSSSDQQKRKA